MDTITKPKKKKKSKKIKIIIFIIIAIIIGIIVITKIVSNNLEGITTGDDEVFDQPTLYTVQNQDLSTYISGTGTIDSDSTVAITSILEGEKVSDLYVAVGDTVTSGQKIAVIDVSSLKSDLSDLQSEYSVEKSSLQKAVDKAYSTKLSTLASLQEEVNDAKNAYDACVKNASEEECVDEKTTYKATLKQYNSSESDLNEEISEAESARDANSKYPSQIKELQKKISAAIIYAPSSGIITSLNITKGSVLASSDIGVIQNSDDYKVSITVPEANILKVKVGMNVKLTVVATGDTTYTGTVSKVNKLPSSGLSDDSSSNSGYKVEVTINDKNTELLIGMTAKCKIYINEVSDSLAVPYDAIMTDNEGKTYVYGIEKISETQYEITYKYVTIGVEGTYYTEIKDGLSKGDLVFVTTEEYDNGETISSTFVDENAAVVGDKNA